jgi:hypothetical protein
MWRWTALEPFLNHTTRGVSQTVQISLKDRVANYDSAIRSGNRSATHKYGRVRKLWNLKVHYRIHHNPPTVTSLSQVNPGHNFSSYFFKMCFNVITTFTPRSSMWSLSFRFLATHRTNLSPPHRKCHTLRLPPIVHDLVNRIVLSKEEF